MIKDVQAWKAWEDKIIRSEPPDFRRNLGPLLAMYNEARMLGRLTRVDPLEGIEVKLRLAQVINV
jgi:hypothetical protein